MTSTIIEIPKASTYGAVEIKEFIRKSTWRGLFITLVLVLMFFVFYYGVGMLSQDVEMKNFSAPISGDIVIQAPSQEDETQEDVAPPPMDITLLTTKARAGTPVAVPDAEIQDELKEFATFDDIDKSLASAEGQLIDLSQMPENIEFGDKPIEIEEREPDMNEFIHLEKNPQVDLLELQKKIVYPELARRVGIEGKVIVRVLVGKDGKPKKAVVQQSDSELLNKAAVDAVMKSVFTPGIQNKKAISCWVSIPISFTLR